MSDQPGGRTGRQLQAWLAERADGFGAWAKQTGHSSERWDFTPDSLDVLEALVRSRYGSEADIHAGRMDPFLQGAIWYIGETACRTKGLVWHYWPFAPRRAQLPDLFTEPDAGFIDTPSVAKARAREGQGTDPLGLVLTLFWEKDDADRPTSTRLRDILN
ncbi:hypothetical protein [Streptomyces sp. NBC_01465]|uniref:hypothetical protein n=1 Tax=Streptomyces sp. NBC_01465 TaxID=2903878 RepID=UPI002E329F67|nr:hypothetical protein [Streptomyces sp. NBC_01465]